MKSRLSGISTVFSDNDCGYDALIHYLVKTAKMVETSDGIRWKDLWECCFLLLMPPIIALLRFAGIIQLSDFDMMCTGFGVAVGQLSIITAKYAWSLWQVGMATSLIAIVFGLYFGAGLSYLDVACGI